MACVLFPKFAHNSIGGTTNCTDSLDFPYEG
ncbi:hypothetical protein EG68_00613 [Paragonimus skrjabini miyazakii]|uniref:Uncharacterized protein n=1 Tax=Paragonimus skrjabini miyazakii TaxID=59628 RepID=A0A8S9Z5C6_9TREM|nr:hypothetical protein EG68_00613 [Paragonimus skrjabini miyazakii]